MSSEINRQRARRRRQLRGRRKIAGSAERPRLCVTKTLKHIYAQIIDDDEGHTLAAASTLEKEICNGISGTANIEAAAAVGKGLAERAVAQGITKVIFDQETHRVIGAAIVGPHAGDLISELALAIEMGCDAQDISLTIHPHPTLSETIAMATEVFEGTITDLYMPK